MSHLYKFESNSEENNCYVDLNNKGEIYFGAYSYYIDSYGHGTLPKEEVIKLYQALKVFFGEENE
jgi:hypothetical protein